MGINAAMTIIPEEPVEGHEHVDLDRAVDDQVERHRRPERHETGRHRAAQAGGGQVVHQEGGEPEGRPEEGESVPRRGGVHAEAPGRGRQRLHGSSLQHQ